jgi:hypothetical protein
MDIKSICVFCSSSSKLDPKYYQLAEKIGKNIAKRGYTLVFGGSDVGMMKSVTNAAIKNGGEVIGVVPTLIKDKVGLVKGMKEIIETKNMFDRKKKMQEISDGFLVLPGGIGTIDEAFDMIVLKQLGYLDGPIIFMNLEGYYETIQDLLQKMVNEKFLKPFDESYVLFAQEHEEIWRYLENYKYKRDAYKWL